MHTPLPSLRDIFSHTILNTRQLTPSTFVLTFTRNNMDFSPGQHISVGLCNDINMREYSIYSGTKQDVLEILIKEIPEGAVSPRLKKLKQNNTIQVEGPLGFFIIEKNEHDIPLYCIATGTGIAPFHCFALSYPEKNFTVLHGIHSSHDMYEQDVFTTQNYIPCVSKDEYFDGKYFKGRVTYYLETQEIDTKGLYFLCGNCNMIYDVFDILHKHGVPTQNIKAEVYF